MAKDITVFLYHIAESANKIEMYLRDITKDTFLSSDQIQDAVIRRLEIIGEAVKNIPDDFKKTYPKMPWRKIAGLRDILIHQYFGIDLELTWQIAIKDVPELKIDIDNVLKELK